MFATRRDGLAALLNGYTIPVARRLGNHQKLHSGRRPITDLMGLACGNRDTLPHLQFDFDPTRLDGQASPQDVEELVCLSVVVPDLRGARRHPFFDDAQRGRLDQMPSIAIAAPGVVGRRFSVDPRHTYRLRSAMGTAQGCADDWISQRSI
jgi:hypothetical protein